MHSDSTLMYAQMALRNKRFKPLPILQSAALATQKSLNGNLPLPGGSGIKEQASYLQGPSEGQHQIHQAHMEERALIMDHLMRESVHKNLGSIEGKELSME